MIKMIVTDLDGTLFKSDHLTISERNIRALKLAGEKGIKIVISSGRAYCLLGDVLTLTKADYVMTSNGAASFDSDGKLLSSDAMDYESWSRLYEVLLKNDIGTEVYCEGNIYIREEELKNYHNPFLGKEALEVLKESLIPCDNVLESLKGKKAEKLHSIYITAENFAYYKTVFEKAGVEVTSSISGNMEINKKGTNKGKGLERLCSALKISLNEVMAFGDEENDIEMLKIVGFSYAVKNASDAVKAAAKYVTESNDDDGVAVEIEKIL